MSTFVEYMSYRADGLADDDLLTLRRQAVLAVRAAHPEFLAVPCIARLADGSWLDAWVWTSSQAASAANAVLSDIPSFAAFYGKLRDVTLTATGVMPQSAVIRL